MDEAAEAVDEDAGALVGVTSGGSWLKSRRHCG